MKWRFGLTRPIQSAGISCEVSLFKMRYAPASNPVALVFCIQQITGTVQRVTCGRTKSRCYGLHLSVWMNFQSPAMPFSQSISMIAHPGYVQCNIHVAVLVKYRTVRIFMIVTTEFKNIYRLETICPSVFIIIRDLGEFTTLRAIKRSVFICKA